MRPEEREERFREGFEAWASGDIERALTFYSRDVEAGAPDWMNPATYRGHEGFLEWSSAWDEAWEEWSLELKEVRAVGERHVVARVHAKGRGRESGIELDHQMGQVVEVDDEGLATYLELTLDEDRALEIAHEREVSN